MIRVLTVVIRLESANTPLLTIFAASRHFRSAPPGSSAAPLLPTPPITPNISTRAPSAARFAATFPAPPRHWLCSTKSTTGTAASGESRDAVPHKYRSSIRSPTTPIRLPRRRGTSRFRRATDWARSVGKGVMDFLRAKRSVGRFGGLVDDQHRNVVADRIDSAAGFALEPAGCVRQLAKRSLALRADKYVEKIFGNQHEGSVVES